MFNGYKPRGEARRGEASNIVLFCGVGLTIGDVAIVLRLGNYSALESFRFEFTANL